MQEEIKRPSNNKKASHAEPSVEMNADELAAFTSMKTEDDSSVDAAIQGDDAHQQTPADAKQVDESEKPSEADFSDELDADQQQAFENIMAQIEGGANTDDTPSESTADEDESRLESPESTVDASDGDPEADFSAELQQVVQQAEAANDTESVAVDTADTADAQPPPSDELDADQQKAFENIMAQIEGGANTDDTPSESTADEDESRLESPESTVDASDGDPEADFSAELQQVAQQAKATDYTEDEKAAQGTNPEATEGLAGATPDTVEDMMGPNTDIGDTETAPTAANGVANDPPDQTPADTSGEETMAAGFEATSDAAEDITDEIDDLLEEIKAADDALVVDTVEAGDDQEAIVSPQTHDDANEIGVAAHPTDTDASALNSTMPEKPLEEKTAASHQEKPSRQTQDKANPRKTATPLPPAARSTRKPKKKRLVISGVLLLLLATTVYLYWPTTTAIFHRPSAPAAPPAGNPQQPIVESPPSSAHQQEPASIDRLSSERSRLKATIEKLDHLRGKVLDKQAEIAELRTYYQDGIDAEIQSIVNSIQRNGNTGISFKAATADPHIQLGLLAIQRRDAYNKKLVSPTKDLLWMSEELLYLSRKAALVTLMMEKTSDIDIDGFIQQTDEISNRHDRELATLNIDAASASPLPLKSIWREITKRLPAAPEKHSSGLGKNTRDSADIAKRICSGDYARKHHLNVLSPQTARCLAQWEGKDLFLNALTELSPESARHLAAWNGEWLGLNGLKELTPESAAHLSQWKGKGLSLNGLSRLSPRVVAILSEWQGEQIELVNVKHMAHWENPKTRLFLSEEMKRKLSSPRN